MGKTWIILAFVVVLIVIVVIAGMRYLRADDDADDFAAEFEHDDRSDAGQRTDEARGRRGTRSADPAGHAPGSRQDRHAAQAGPRAASRARPAGQASATAAGGGRMGTATIARERGGQDEQPASRPGSRRVSRRSSGAPPDGDILPPVRSRSGRGKRDDGDWPTSDWDKLSDVDFWHEVAADKPFTTDDAGEVQVTAKAPRGRRSSQSRTDQSRTDQSHSDQSRLGTDDRSRARAADAPLADHADQPAARRPDRAAAAREDQPARRPDQGRPGRGGPSRDRRPARLTESAGLDTVAMPQQPAAAPEPPLLPAGRMPPPGRAARTAGRPASQPVPAASEPTLAMLAGMGADTAGRGRDDDDPLTSPSFPRVAGEDSRSYRRDRSGQHPRPPRTPDTGATEQFSRFASAPPAAAAARQSGAGFRDAADDYRPKAAPAAIARPEPRPDPYPSLPPAAYADDAPYVGRAYAEAGPTTDSLGAADRRSSRRHDARAPREALVSAAVPAADYGSRGGAGQLATSGQHAYPAPTQPAAADLLSPAAGGLTARGYDGRYPADVAEPPARRGHGAHAVGSRAGTDRMPTGGGYGYERESRERETERYDAVAYPEPASRRRDRADRAADAGYGRSTAGYDQGRTGPGPATWYLGMDPAAQAPGTPARRDRDPTTRSAGRASDSYLSGTDSYLSAGAGATASYPAGGYGPGNQGGDYLAAPTFPAAPAGGYVGSDPYATDYTSYRGDGNPLR